MLRPETLAELSVDTLQGTNLQHGLMLARRFLAQHRDAEPVVLVVTDGEPTAHLRGRRDAVLLLAADARDDRPHRGRGRAGAPAPARRSTCSRWTPSPALVHFVHDITARAGGRVFQPDADRLGEYVVADYLRARRGPPRPAECDR